MTNLLLLWTDEQRADSIGTLGNRQIRTWSSLEDGYVRDHARDGFSTYHQWLVAQGFTPPDAAPDGTRVFSRSSAARLPEAAGKPAFLAEAACRFLDGVDRQPFLLSVNFLEPHMPFNGPWDGMYAPEGLALPVSWYREPDETVDGRGGRRVERRGGRCHGGRPPYRLLRRRRWGSGGRARPLGAAADDPARALEAHSGRSGRPRPLDLVDDPGELRNVIGVPGGSGTPGSITAAQDLWSRLRAWQQRTGDQLRLPDPVS